MYTVVLVFILVYLAMGLGKLPYFNVDRTGAALLGALALVVAGRISPEAAWMAIDYKTIWLLFGLMVVSGAFTQSEPRRVCRRLIWFSYAAMASVSRAA
jgi:Na+/H+ antiporter NhaD and related arsenite permeases